MSKDSVRHAYIGASPTEWGSKARKAEAKNFRSTARRWAISDQLSVTA